jgi:DNA polymerase III alpha subunit
VARVKIDNYGQVELSEQEVFQALYEGKIPNLKDVHLDDESSIQQFNAAKKVNADRISDLKSLERLDISIEDFDKLNQKQWFMPENYFPNLVEWLFEQCQTQEQKNRVAKELELFIQYEMMGLLHYIKYLVDTMRKQGIVWGVGRGSSVASYVLFLIGAHKVDSIRYNLDINEFLK